jgi:hypothetical protein
MNFNEVESFEDFDAANEPEICYWQIIRKYQCQCGGKFCCITKKTESPEPICPKCGVEMDSILSGSPDFMMNNVTTLGQLGERNWKDLGHYKRSEMEMDMKPKLQKDAERKKLNKLGNATPEQKRRYIENGII